MSISPDNPGLFTLALWLNPFLVNEEACRESRWYKWIERIMISHDEHADDIIKKHGEHDRYVSQEHYADVAELALITEGMYASLIVTMQSYIESFFGHTCKAIYLNINKTHQLYSLNSSKHPPKKITSGNAKKYIITHTSVDPDSAKCSAIAEAVRVLANTYKHNSGIYKVRDNQLIAANLLGPLGVKADEFVLYSELPFCDLLVGCGQYCEDLKSKISGTFI